MTDWAAAAAVMQALVFPIIIEWDTNRGKWTKKPLTRHGHKDASTDVSRFDWSRANGFGIRTGDGWYVLDLDSYKLGCQAELWLAQWRVPMETRMHQTVSGGFHLIYRTIGEWENLRNRQNIVEGLDARGSGGWIAFGEGYALARNAQPAILPDAVCFELSRASAGRGVTRSAGAVQLQPVVAVDVNATWKKLRLAVSFERPKLLARWQGGTFGLHDTSASGFDMSIAKLLAYAAFNYDEIYWLLITQFQHGVVARDGLTKTTDRAIKRVAARATQNSGVMSAKLQEMFYGP
jgi:hypothetical protein